MDKAIDINKFIEINKNVNDEKTKFKQESSNSDEVQSTILKKNNQKLQNKENSIKSENKSVDNKKSLENKTKEISTANINQDLKNRKQDNVENENRLKYQSIEKTKIEKKTVNKILSEKFIYDNWNNLLSSLNKANIVHSLEKIKIKELSENKISIIVLDIGEFMYKNLLNEVALINASINKYFNVNLSLDLLHERKQIDKLKPSIKTSNLDKEHPLFMNAMNKFEGEIIK
jgi:hypothetical protein